MSVQAPAGHPSGADPDAAEELLPVAPGEGAAGRLSRLGPRSLTGRLVLGVVGLVVVLVLAIGSGTFFALKSFLADRLDQQLQTTVNQGAYRIFNGAPPNTPTPLEVYAIALEPESGQILAEPASSAIGVESINLSTQLRRSLANRGTTAPMTIETLTGEELRITVQDAEIRDAPADDNQVKLIIGLSTGDERSTLRRLVLLEALIGGLAVLLALMATTYGVKVGLRRLRRVTSTAQEVAAELSPEGAGLDRRVPDDEPGTEVGQLATSFNTMLSAVETQFAARLESEHRLRQFLADASHELRTPLTSIRGYAELARMQRAVGDDSSDNLDRIESEGTRMSRLVEDLLMLARGDATSTDGDSPAPLRESVDVPAMLDDVVSSSRAAFPDRPIELLVDAVPDVLGDRDQLLRAIRNLVTNACVHTEDGRPIMVRGFTQGGGVVITVVDGGPGLPPDQAAHVFERFWRADKARTRARGGTGLGMSIVATIVRAHGGSVRFESTVEGGSTVTLWLPVAG